MSDDFTPTEDLVLDVLAARRRLGESLWTFGTGAKRALISLEARGLIWTMHGIVEKTVRVSLTELGVERCLSADYQSPLEKAREALAEALDQRDDIQRRFLNLQHDMRQELANTAAREAAG